MNYDKYFRMAIQFILLIVLFIVTFIQLLKYQKENTNVSISYEDRDLELPSMTICLMYEGNNEKQGNITFEEYMKGVLNISEILDIVVLHNRSDNRSLKNNTYWKNSYYLYNWLNKRLAHCWTLDPPETRVSKPEKPIVITEK